MTTSPESALRARLCKTYHRMATEARYRPAARADQATGALCSEDRQDSLDVEADRWALRWLIHDEEAVEEALLGAANYRTRHINAVQVEALRATYSARDDLAADLTALVLALLREEDPR